MSLHEPAARPTTGHSSTTVTSEHVDRFRGAFDAMVDNIAVAVLGKSHEVRLTLTCMVADGHLLLEGFPGTGKTMLARALANTIDCSHARIQFTPDLLPSDVTGVTVYDQHKGTFEFHPGPIFHNLVLADEINRGSPKTQSALLEVMEEKHVTVDGITHSVPEPFMVIATQNPIEQSGTYRLPEAQLDRFLMQLTLGYPDAESTEEMLMSAEVRDRAGLVSPVTTAATITEMRTVADAVYVDRSLITYVRQIADRSREMPEVGLGLSARACLALIRTAKAWAAASGRFHVVPEDIVVLAPPILGHRILLTAEATFAGATVDEVVRKLLESVPVPEDRS
ncbi:MAG: MoxR family ATPase [Marmoricola sp.]|nr:MoxR family ATPase [Marmoricola sp.]